MISKLGAGGGDGAGDGGTAGGGGGGGRGASKYASSPVLKHSSIAQRGLPTRYFSRSASNLRRACRYIG